MKLSDSLISYFHLGKFTPNTSQVVNTTICDFCRFLKYHPRFSDLFMFLVKFGELNPECMRFSCGLLRVDSLDGFSVRVDDVFWFAFEKFNSFVPFVNIVGVLTKQYAVIEKILILKLMYNSNSLYI